MTIGINKLIKITRFKTKCFLKLAIYRGSFVKRIETYSIDSLWLPKKGGYREQSEQ